MDIPRAVEILERAHQDGSMEATFNLARLLTLTSDGPPIDFERGIRLYEDLILKYNDMASMVCLAQGLRRSDHGNTRDIPRSVELCEWSIAQGLHNDEEELVKLGIEVRKPFDLGEGHIASRLLRQNVEDRWYLFAMCELTDILATEGSKNEFDRALSLFERALKDSRASATFQIEPLFEVWENIGRVSIDYYIEALKKICEHPRENEELCKRALKFYELVIGRTGSTKLMCLLADILWYEDAGIPRDRRKAICLYKRAIFKGDTSAKLALGEILSTDSLYIYADRRYAAELFVRIVEIEGGGPAVRSAIVNLALIFENERRRKSKRR